jgi:antitoxin component YwqK of YwqJK toxin-antitoxin module
MKIIKTLLFIACCTQFFAQTTIKIDQTDVNNGIYYYNNTPFSGVIVKIENNLLLEKYSVKEGKKNGQFIEYFFDARFKKENYKDTVLINSLGNSIKNLKSDIPKLINDTINSWNSFSNYFNQEIGGAKKLEKLNEKFNSQKLKGDQLDLWNNYVLLKNNHNKSNQVLKSAYAEVNKKEFDLNTELNKPEYIPRKKMVYNILNGKKDGEYVEYFGNEQLKVKGIYKTGLQEGIWEYFDESGKIIAKGPFISGDGSDVSGIGVPRNGRDGNWTTYHSNGNIDQVGNWKAGKQNGSFNVKNPNGILTEESFYSSGKLNGHLKKYNDQGVLVLDDQYIDDKKNGLCREFYPSGNIKSEGYYKNNVLNGNLKVFHENGKVEVDMMYRDNIANGPAKNYYENGKIKLEGQYVNGKIHGPSKIYYESGQLQLVGFVDTNSQFEGHLSGEITNYNEDGSIKLMAIIHNDGTVIDKTPKPKSILSEAELKKPYRCQCCKATINGLYDGVDKNGSSADEYTLTYLYKVWSDPGVKDSFSKLGVNGTAYDMIRDSYKFCTMKCSRTCYDY